MKTFINKKQIHLQIQNMSYNYTLIKRNILNKTNMKEKKHPNQK